MDPLLWVAWPAFWAIAGSMLVYFIMESRLEVLLAQQREELAAARAALAAQTQMMEQSLRNAEDHARSRAMDEFLADIRIEERHYTRQHKALFMTRKSLVRQERIFFRNIPLTNWIEQEMPLEEGMDPELLAQTTSIFNGEVLLGGEAQPRKLLRSSSL